MVLAKNVIHDYTRKRTGGMSLMHKSNQVPNVRYGVYSACLLLFSTPWLISIGCKSTSLSEMKRIMMILMVTISYYQHIMAHDMNEGAHTLGASQQGAQIAELQTLYMMACSGSGSTSHSMSRWPAHIQCSMDHGISD